MSTPSMIITRKLAEEAAGADLPKEQAGCSLRGEASPLSLSIYVDWYVHLSSLSFPILCVPNFFLFLPQFWFPTQAAPACPLKKLTTTKIIDKHIATVRLEKSNSS
jgi:hypothetical protein